MPGMFVQTMAFGIGETLAAVQADSAKGVTDRFRSMPMAPSAVVVGRCVSGMLYSAASLTLVVACGLAVGWRWHGSPVETAGAFGLLLLLRMAFLWIGIYLRAAGQEPGDGQLDLRPAVPGDHAVERLRRTRRCMPPWLGRSRRGTRCRATVTATRDLFGNPGVGGEGWVVDHAVGMAIVWPLLITAVTLPVAVRTYQHLSR